MPNRCGRETGGSKTNARRKKKKHSFDCKHNHQNNTVAYKGTVHCYIRQVERMPRATGYGKGKAERSSKG